MSYQLQRFFPNKRKKPNKFLIRSFQYYFLFIKTFSKYFLIQSLAYNTVIFSLRSEPDDNFTNYGIFGCDVLSEKVGIYHHHTFYR